MANGKEEIDVEIGGGNSTENDVELGLGNSHPVDQNPNSELPESPHPQLPMRNQLFSYVVEKVLPVVTLLGGFYGLVDFVLETFPNLKQIRGTVTCELALLCAVVLWLLYMLEQRRELPNVILTPSSNQPMCEAGSLQYVLNTTVLPVIPLFGGFYALVNFVLETFPKLRRIRLVVTFHLAVVCTLCLIFLYKSAQRGRSSLTPSRNASRRLLVVMVTSFFGGIYLVNTRTATATILSFGLAFVCTLVAARNKLAQGRGRNQRFSVFMEMVLHVIISSWIMFFAVFYGIDFLLPFGLVLLWTVVTFLLNKSPFKSPFFSTSQNEPDR